MKIGDIVQVKPESPWGQADRNLVSSYWNYPAEVISISKYDDSLTVEILEGPYKGRQGGFRPDHLQLVDVNKSLTDEQLADKYRKVREESRAIFLALQGRGYKGEFKSNVTKQWNEFRSATQPQEFRFTKTETITKTI